MVRTTGDPKAIDRAVRRAAVAADPDQALIDVRPMHETAVGSIALRRFTTLLLSTFAGVALLLTAIGIYGTVAFSASARRRELGIRAALGARPSDLLVLVGRQGVGLTALGFAIGIPGALALTRLLTSQLYGVTPHDPLVLTTAAAVLGAVALTAAYLPTRRAASADPVRALGTD